LFFPKRMMLKVFFGFLAVANALMVPSPLTRMSRPQTALFKGICPECEQPETEPKWDKNDPKAPPRYLDAESNHELNNGPMWAPDTIE